jgi:hypothetical protein
MKSLLRQNNQSIDLRGKNWAARAKKEISLQRPTDTRSIGIHVIDFQVTNVELVKNLRVEVIWNRGNKAFDSDLATYSLKRRTISSLR